MEKKQTMIGIGAVVAAAVLSVMRVIAMPRVVEGTAGIGSNIAMLALTAAVLIALLLSGGVKRRPGKVLRGRALSAVTVGALFTGAAMIVSSVVAMADWMIEKQLPYPANVTVTDTDGTLLYLLVLLGVVSGGFFLFLSFRWFPSGRTERGILRVVALAPVLWCWIRIFRYELSYISSLNVYRNIYDLLLIIVEMLFFLGFARYVSGQEENPSRFLTGLSLCAGVLATAACATRVAMALSGNAEAFNACGLTTAADLGVAVLAFAFGFGQLTAREEHPAAKPVPVPVPAAPADAFGAAPDVPAEEHRPMGVEDILNEIMQRIENGEN